MKNINEKECHQAFGKYIKTARERKGLSQIDASRILGVSQSYLSRIESGERDIDLAFSFKICDVMGVDIRDFVNKYM